MRLKDREIPKFIRTMDHFIETEEDMAINQEAYELFKILFKVWHNGAIDKDVNELKSILNNDNFVANCGIFNSPEIEGLKQVMYSESTKPAKCSAAKDVFLCLMDGPLQQVIRGYLASHRKR